MRRIPRTTWQDRKAHAESCGMSLTANDRREIEAFVRRGHAITPQHLANVWALPIEAARSAWTRFRACR